MRKFAFAVTLLLIVLFSGCIEQRSKELITDSDGGTETIVSITQSAKISFDSYSCNKTPTCGTQVNILITIQNKDIVKDSFIFVDKGISPEATKPINVRSGDQIKLKITNGCPNMKYTILFSLDTGD